VYRVPSMRVPADGDDLGTAPLRASLG
jgi:hypothetical protein